ncbi:TIGR00730 family Rossman fold protein [Streptomyces cylindrosporus]|uniref:LOG family protein n=1 Tax=Streptomyces cylindrosporus TaxID=2927583 RepID=UPI0027E271A4|nr:TIGR00730 family Rossman fold protein [Streptomyces cylindrosporus]
MNSVTVFRGASAGRDITHLRIAAELGRAIAGAGLRLVYGGAAIGLMGAVADAALHAGGIVIGVLPAGLVPREIAHRGLTELRIVADMHQRKALMSELGDAFVALPGGLGTAEELFEALTWSQLGIHHKPCVLLDHNG